MNGWFSRSWALVLLIFGFLPIANWIPGGHEAPFYLTSVSEWVSGSAIAVGVATILFLAGRRLGAWPADGLRNLSIRAAGAPAMTSVVLGVVAAIVYVAVAQYVLSGRPLLIDEIVQVMQARIFAEGRASWPVEQVPEFFSALNVVDVGDRVFSQFPPGGPLMLLPGVMAGVPWLTGPAFGVVAVVAFWRLVRSTEEPGTALGAALLFVLAPFMVFMAGSHMNHVPTLAWLCVALWSLNRLMGQERPGIGLAALCGLSLGLMTSIRPVDGAAFALPAGIWMLWRTLRGRMSWPALLAAGAGVALPMIAVLLYNRATTGSATLFGYELLWGSRHGLGFHQAPWGVSHTPARGLELVSLYFLRLQTYLYETPVPSLVPVIAALLLVPRLSSFDRYLLSGSGLLVLGYFAYWHDGFFLGPRFFYLLLPMLVLWTARLPGLAGRRLPERWAAQRMVVLVYVVSALISLGVSVPVRVRQYAGDLSSMRHDYTAPARDAGVDSAVILVRESWGAQLVARLWALGVPRSETEGIYRTVDTCLLEGAVTRLEVDGVRGRAATESLLRLTGDSLRTIGSQLSPDGTERVLPGTPYGPTCQRRIFEDRGGYSFFAPILARDPGTNVYGRDLHGRDSLLLAQYAGRPVYLLRAASSGVGAPLVLAPLNTDSAWREWRGTTVVDTASR